MEKLPNPRHHGPGLFAHGSREVITTGCKNEVLRFLLLKKKGAGPRKASSCGLGITKVFTLDVELQLAQCLDTRPTQSCRLGLLAAVMACGAGRSRQNYDDAAHSHSLTTRKEYETSGVRKNKRNPLIVKMTFS